MYSVCGVISLIKFTFVLSTCRKGKCSSISWKVKMFNSFFNSSARWGPTPFRYSIGLANMVDTEEIKIL
jgi:hypothetical protein